MRRAFLRSSPFRITAVLGLAFLLALLVAGSGVYLLIREELLARTDRMVEDTFDVIKQSYGENDLTDLTDLLSSHVRAAEGGNEIFLLQSLDQQRIVGNISKFNGPEGWSNLSSAALGLAEGQGEYRVFAGAVGPYMLVVGISLEQTRELGALVLSTLAWIGGGLAVVIVSIGLILAGRGQKRLDAIAATMDRVAHGELDARIPRSYRNDDIDVLIGSVNDALDRLVALVEGMRQVSVDIAHELKTPLNRLAIAVSGAIEADAAGQPMGDLLAEAEAEAVQINTIFDAMLRIAQIESGARKARFTNVGLSGILENVAEAYDAVAVDHGHSLTLSLGDELGQVWGDRDLLMQAVANLVENAIRHCPPGARIRIEGRIEQGRPGFVVADDGPGVPDDEMTRVFNRLYRVEKSRTTPGNGLGLSLVKAVIELHGGTIALANSHPGLMVVVSLPRNLTPSALSSS